MKKTEKSPSIDTTKKDKPVISDRNKHFITIILMTLIGFFVGSIDFKDSAPEIIEKPIESSIPQINLSQRNGDEIVAEISGEVKLTWGDSYVLQESGSVFWGQIATVDDLVLKDFKYLANGKTKKFYPADSYPARGTEVKYRRFFQTKEDATNAGFIASKLVK